LETPAGPEAFGGEGGHDALKEEGNPMGPEERKEETGREGLRRGVCSVGHEMKRCHVGHKRELCHVGHGMEMCHVTALIIPEGQNRSLFYPEELGGGLWPLTQCQRHGRWTPSIISASSDLAVNAVLGEAPLGSPKKVQNVLLDLLPPGSWMISTTRGCRGSLLLCSSYPLVMEDGRI
ncbi:hypothetical protein Taro_031059, partial [Colocasia esculenta]|nr:hypothetical protein [Colocasia esculenta]